MQWIYICWCWNACVSIPLLLLLQMSCVFCGTISGKGANSPSRVQCPVYLNWWLASVNTVHLIWARFRPPFGWNYWELSALVQGTYRCCCWNALGCIPLLLLLLQLSCVFSDTISGKRGEFSVSCAQHPVYLNWWLDSVNTVHLIWARFQSPLRWNYWELSTFVQGICLCCCSNSLPCGFNFPCEGRRLLPECILLLTWGLKCHAGLPSTVWIISWLHFMYCSTVPAVCCCICFVTAFPHPFLLPLLAFTGGFLFIFVCLWNWGNLLFAHSLASGGVRTVTPMVFLVTVLASELLSANGASGIVWCLPANIVRT